MTPEHKTSDEPIGSHRFFQSDRQRVDSVVTLFALAQAMATDAHVIVEVGCGRGVFVDQSGAGRPLHDLRATGRQVIGIDVDSHAAENPVVDEFRLIDDGAWPLEDESVDLVHCDWVLEHVTDPADFVSELHRVLRPGGAFVARTVNRHSLLAVAARTVPNRRHAVVLESLQPGREAQDVFPTAYRMNTARSLHALLDREFDWATSFHPGLEHYADRWPKAAAVVAAIESRLPRKAQMVLLVMARKR